MSGLRPVPRIPKRRSMRNGSDAASNASPATGRPTRTVSLKSPTRAIKKAREASVRAPIAIADATPSPGRRTVPHATAVSTERPTAGASQDHRRHPQRANTPWLTRHEAARMTRNDPYVASIAGELSLRDSMGHVPAVPTEGGANVWLVLPTYNEASNLEPVVAAAREHLRQARRILLVDDSSPEGTGEIAERLAASHQDVSVLHRPRKEGLGPAYIAGFREALAGGADLVVQMDADFSHDPTDLPRLLAGARDADLVLGSRYVPGGAVEDWGPLRRFISRGGCAYARK